MFNVYSGSTRNSSPPYRLLQNTAMEYLVYLAVILIALYQTASWFLQQGLVTVTSGRELKTISYIVQHESLPEPLQEDFHLVYGEQTRKIHVIGVCCAAALVAAVGFGFLIWQQKSRKRAKPRLVEPVKMTLWEKSQIQISLCLERFYPGDLEITWSHERNQSKYLLSSTESVTEGKDLTFNVTSDCNVSGSFFAESRNKVFVEWKHESLDVPECRSWSSRDLPWRPVMEDIIIPKLEAGKEAALSCKISGYFPDSLSVQWIKKQKGNKSEITYWTWSYKVSDDKSIEETDKTFSRETRLTFTPHPDRDLGAEFICRVTHPTLEEPIEMTTGPLVFNRRPDVSDIKWSISGRMYLEVNKFYPRDIGITWRLDEESGGNQCQYLKSSITDNGVNRDGTYDITSTCDPLGDKVKKSKTYIVKAFVKHVTLKTEVIKTNRVIH